MRQSGARARCGLIDRWSGCTNRSTAPVLHTRTGPAPRRDQAPVPSSRRPAVGALSIRATAFGGPAGARLAGQHVDQPLLRGIVGTELRLIHIPIEVGWRIG